MDELRNQLSDIIEEGEMITFRQWITNGSDDRGKDNQRCALKTFNLSSVDFIDEFCRQMIKLTLHHFTWINQRNYFRNAKEKAQNNPKGNEVVIQVDFAENFATVYQNEIQNKYYFKDQVTLHNV